MFHQVDSVRLNVIVEGTGPPVVLLHPLGGSWRYWEAQLDDLAADHRCIVPDLRGFGASDRPAAPFSFEELADDVAALCRSLDAAPVAVVGLSMGGMVAQHLAVRHPGLVDALVLAATSCWSDPALVEAVQGATALIDQHGISMFVEMSGAMSWDPSTPAARPELLRRFRREEGSTDPLVYAAAVSAVATLDTRDALAAVNVPTLVVWGEHDQWMPIDHAHRLVDVLPDARLEVIADAGHLCNIERPDSFSALVRAFLAERTARTID